MPTAAARVRIVVLAMTLVGSMSACSSGDEGAKDAADALAEALTAGDVSRVAVVATKRPPQSDLERIVEGLGDDSPQVSVTDVTTEGRCCDRHAGHDTDDRRCAMDVRDQGVAAEGRGAVAGRVGAVDRCRRLR